MRVTVIESNGSLSVEDLNFLSVKENIDTFIKENRYHIKYI